MILWGQWQKWTGRGQLTSRASKMKKKVLVCLARTSAWDKTLGFNWNAKLNEVPRYSICFQNSWLQIAGRRLTSELSSGPIQRNAKLWSLALLPGSLPLQRFRLSSWLAPGLHKCNHQKAQTHMEHPEFLTTIAVPWKNVPTVHLRLWMRGNKGRPLCAPKDAGCSFCHSLPYRAAFRLPWMVTGASGPIVLSQLSGISGDQWVRLCRSCFSGSLPFRNSFAPRESSNSCLGWLGDSFVLPELGKAAPAGPRTWLLACNLLI